MVTITIEEFQRDLRDWPLRVVVGETLILTQAGKPVAEVTPIALVADADAKLRPIGLCAGEFIVPDDFDDPLPETLLAAFEAREDEPEFSRNNE